MAMPKDPVCGMGVMDKKFSAVYKGKKYFFCTAGDKREFKKNPAKYIKR